MQVTLRFENLTSLLDVCKKNMAATIKANTQCNRIWHQHCKEFSFENENGLKVAVTDSKM